MNPEFYERKLADIESDLEHINSVLADDKIDLVKRKRFQGARKLKLVSIDFCKKKLNANK